MSDEQVAARDATFDNVVPERLWISVRSSPDREYILVIADINGIEKEIQRVYVGDYDGVLSSSTQLTWVLNQANDALKTKLQAAEGDIDRLKRWNDENAQHAQRFLSQRDQLHEAIALAVKALEFYEKREREMQEFEEAFQDDSDDENNSQTNGYFPPRPSEYAMKEYDEYRHDEGSLARTTLAQIRAKVGEGK